MEMHTHTLKVVKDLRNVLINITPFGVWCLFFCSEILNSTLQKLSALHFAKWYRICLTARTFYRVIMFCNSLALLTVRDLAPWYGRYLLPALPVNICYVLVCCCPLRSIVGVHWRQLFTKETRHCAISASKLLVYIGSKYRLLWEDHSFQPHVDSKHANLMFKGDEHFV